MHHRACCNNIFIAKSAAQIFKVNIRVPTGEVGNKMEEKIFDTFAGGKWLQNFFSNVAPKINNTPAVFSLKGNWWREEAIRDTRL